MNQDSKVGKVLPKGFHGHPAKMKASTIDASAAVARKGRPSAKLTMTCNCNWEAFQANNPLPDQTAFDRPDLCDKVFKIKRDEFMKDLRSGRIFGPVTLEMSCIEWQNRRLPQICI